MSLGGVCDELYGCAWNVGLHYLSDVFIVSIALLISSATINVRAGEPFG